MKKYMVADFVKEFDPKILDWAEKLGVDPSKITEDDIDNLNETGVSGNLSLGSLGDADYEYDLVNQNYVITVHFSKTGNSYEYIGDSDDILELEDKGAKYYLSNMRQTPMPWPFGDPEFLHWPNQTK
jgi:hypothetical protein